MVIDLKKEYEFSDLDKSLNKPNIKQVFLIKAPASYT